MTESLLADAPALSLQPVLAFAEPAAITLPIPVAIPEPGYVFGGVDTVQLTASTLAHRIALGELQQGEDFLAFGVPGERVHRAASISQIANTVTVVTVLGEAFSNSGPGRRETVWRVALIPGVMLDEE